MATQNMAYIPKLTILYPGGDQLTSLLLEKEKNTVIEELIERMCNLRAIDSKHLKAYNEEGKKIDTKLTLEQSGVVFIELMDKKNKNKGQKVKSHIEDTGAGKIRKGKPDGFVIKVGHAGIDIPLRKQLFDDEWETLQNFKSKNEICKSYSDEFIMCCLWARKLDEARTLKLLQENLQWRKVNGFMNIPSIREIEGIISSLSLMNCMIPGARDKNGGGVMYTIVRKEFIFGKEPFTVEFLKKWIVWFYFVGIFFDGMDSLRHGITIIEDITEFGWNHFDLDVQKQMNLTSIFPIRVKRFIMINPPVIFNAIIKIAKTFVSAKLLDRMETTNKVKDCTKYVSTDQLWTQFAGEIDYSPKDWTEKLIAWSHQNEANYQVSIQDK